MRRTLCSCVLVLACAGDDMGTTEPDGCDNPDAVESAECYSPCQNLDIAYEPDAMGCRCDPSADESVCIDGVALLCRDGSWQSAEDGPCMQ